MCKITYHENMWLPIPLPLSPLVTFFPALHTSPTSNSLPPLPLVTYLYLYLKLLHKAAAYPKGCRFFLYHLLPLTLHLPIPH